MPVISYVYLRKVCCELFFMALTKGPWLLSVILDLAGT